MTLSRTRLFWLVSAVLFIIPSAWAQHISEAEALQRAQTFLREQGRELSVANELSLASKGRKAKKQTTQEASYYVFNISNQQGFVIMSGDERTPAVLGYADSGSISDDSMPDGLRYLLDGYTSQIDELDIFADNYSDRMKVRKTAGVRSPISPLIETRWNQGAPYNKLCPESNSEKTVTGCVATAMAQLMYYHQYPSASIVAIPGYTTRKLKIELGELATTSFDWNSMTPTYTSTSNGTSADAVALLMQYCGWSLQMNYNLSSAGGSSAYNESIPAVLKEYFDYDSGTRHTYRSTYSYQEWIDLIYNELAEERPVILGGQSVGSGHSFVCDGYDNGDYFHINWGWGGSSDGYFRLSALNPYDQGIGGSSTLDGFSFSQDAIIGIQRPTTGTDSYCLSLEGLRFGGNDDKAKSSMTFTRDIESGSFTGISLYVKVCCYQYGSHAFDYAVQLTDADGNMVHTLYESTNHTMNFDNSLTPTLALSIPSAVGDGTYYIKVMSRPSETREWQQCYDGDRYQLTAIISGDQLTINVPHPSTGLPTFKSMTVEGNLTLGYEQEVIVSLIGSTADYHGNLVLRVNDKSVMGKQVDIPAGQTVDVRFVYTPTAAGSNVLKLFNAKSGGTEIGSETVAIAESDASNTQTITLSATFGNLANGKLYGNAVKVTATVGNPSAANSFASKLNCSLRTYNSAEDEVGDYAYATVKSKNISIDKSGSTDVKFEFDGLEQGKFYCLRFTYVQGYTEEETQKTRTQEALITERYQMDGGYKIYNANGTYTLAPTASEIDAEDARCVDLTPFGSLDGVSITPSSNPNCLYILPTKTEAPASLSGCNVICDGNTSALNLSDGYDFFTPISFIAENVSYTRTFTLAAGGTQGWNTIFLPFAVETITVDDGSDGGKEVDWFHSSEDTGKNFWLREFTSDSEGTVVFDFAKAMKAYTPYIIAVPGDTWGEEWQMTDRAVTFSGSKATITATADASVSGNHYAFCGNTQATHQSDIYVLNDKGSRFSKAASATDIDPFRAWFSPISISSLSLASLSIGSPTPTSLWLNPINAAPVSEWYTMDGRKLQGKPQRKGMYIQSSGNSSRKVIIK